MSKIGYITKEELKSLYWDLGSLRKVGERLGVDVSTVARRMKELDIPFKSWYAQVTARKDIYKMIDQSAPKSEMPLKLSGDWIITSDWHIPAIRMSTYERLLEIAKEKNIKNIIIAGDFVNFDLISYYWQEKPDIHTTTVEEEINIAKKILRELETVFSGIVWLAGNHERRLYNTMKGGVGADTLATIMECKLSQYEVTNMTYCYLDDIRITHPRSYRQTKLSVANALSAKYNCPVLQAHGHFFSLSYSAGGHLIGDTGGLMDFERIQYLSGGDTTHPLWNNGFFVYKDKKVIPYGDRIGA